MGKSLKDIAEAFKVSKTTVSWVLSGRGDEQKISSATQKKIIDYAKQVKYRPNYLAKSLSSGKTKTIGLVVPFIGDTFYAQVAMEVELVAEQLGYTVTFCSSESNPVRENNIIQMLRSKNIDGLIIAPTNYAKSELENLIQEKYPFVLIDRFFPELNTNYIIIDNIGCSYNLVNKLINEGRKKIAIITTASALFTMSLRYEGYKTALIEHDCFISPHLYGEVSRNEYELDIIRVLDTIFDAVPDVDGFYFTTHYLGMEGLRYFYKRNIDVSKIGLACLHSTPSFELLAPNMHIAYLPIKEIGRESVRVLIEKLETTDNEDEKVKLVLPVCD